MDKTPDKATLFRKKAYTYMCCFCNQCPRHKNCLRWEAGQYIDPKLHVTNCISPLYGKAQDGSCEFFRDNKPLTMPVGMKNFYCNMPGHIERAIKSTLIDHSCRATYYKYHRGDRPINPKFLADIQNVCRQFGWTEPLHFDGEVTDYWW